MNNSLVSIIVPCYKQAHLLPETLDSVLKQTYRNWECVIVNDGSPDNTSEVANQYIMKDKRFVLLEQKNQGLAMARNNGIKKSQGQYILPLDSDDLIEPSYIEKAIDYFEKNPNTKLVYCKADRFDQKREFWNLPDYKYELEIWQNVIFCSAVYRRSDYDKTIGYNPNMKGGFEDWDFWLSFLKKEDVVFQIPEILFHYRYRKNSMLMNTVDKRENLCKQIYYNHPEIYLNTIDEIVYTKHLLSLNEPLLKMKLTKLVKLYRLIKNKISSRILMKKYTK